MSIVQLADAKLHARVTIDADDALIQDMINAAETHLGNYLGAALSTFIPAASDSDPSPTLPDPLQEAVKQLVGFFYDNREAAAVGNTLNVIPMSPGFYDLLAVLQDLHLSEGAMSKQSEALRKRLEAIPKAVRAAVQPALIKSGEELADRMKTLVHVDHGALRDSITVTLPGATPRRQDREGNSGLRERGAGHATYVEYGHKTKGGGHVPAEPFFWPAYRLSKKREVSRIGRAITAAVKGAWEK